jgi:hypothetical protein
VANWAPTASERKRLFREIALYLDFWSIARPQQATAAASAGSWLYDAVKRAQAQNERTSNA